MHEADLVPLLFVGGVFVVLTGRLFVSYFKAKLV